MSEEAIQKTEELIQNESELKRCSSSTHETEFEGLPELFEEEMEPEPVPELSNSFVNQKLILNEGSQLSPVIQKKAINWLITFCWTKDFSEQILWSSIGYFYSYVNSKVLIREKLTLLLLTLVNLSLKLIEPLKVMKISDLEHVLVTKSDKQMFLEMEQEVLEAFGFELYFHNNLSKALSFGPDCQKMDKILFLSELMFLKSYEIAINDNLLQEIEAIVDQPEAESQAKEILRAIAKGSKYCQAIKQKYSSRFEVEEIWEKIIT